MVFNWTDCIVKIGARFIKMCSLSQQITQLRKKPIRWHVSGLFVFLYIFKYPGCVLFFTLVYKSFPLHFFSCAVSVINRITGG